MISLVGALVCAAAPGAAVWAATAALLDCSGALSLAVAGRTWLDVGDAFGTGGGGATVACAYAGLASTSVNDIAETPHFSAQWNFGIFPLSY
jgi:hypothetical protein